MIQYVFSLCATLLSECCINAPNLVKVGFKIRKLRPVAECCALRTQFKQLRAEDSSDDLRRYQECAKKLDECSKNLLRLCQVSGELNNLNDDDIERAANEIIRTEEEEAKKIAAELLHQKGLLHRNLQDPEVSATGYLNQEDCGPRPRSGGAAKSNTGPSGRRTDYEVPKTLKNQQQQSATDQRPNVHQQVINQPPYAIIHCEERVPCQPCPSQQYSNSGMSRSNPCADYSSSQLRVPTASTPYVTKGDGSERRGPPYFRQAQQQPAQSTWNRPEPVWNPTVSRKTDPSGLSNSRLLDQCKEQARKMNEMTQSSTPESTKRGAKPQTIHLTAGAGRSADPPVHIVITAIANDCDNHGPQQQESYPRAPVYSDNEFAEESAYSLGNKGPSTIYSSPTGDDCVPQKYLGSQQKLVDRGCDAYNSPDDVNPSSSRPTYKEILDTILSQRPHDAESLLKSKGILNCAIKCWENTKNNLRAKSAQQTNSRRGVQYQTIYECQEQTSYPSQTQSNGLSFPQQNRSTEWMQPNPRVEYSQSCTDGPVKPLASTPGGSRQKSVKCPPRDLKDYREQMYVGSKDQVNPMHKTVILKCCQVPTEAKSKQVAGNRRDAVQSRPGTADMMETLRQYRTPAAPTPCRDRKNQYEEQQFLANPIQTQFGANPPLRGAGQQYQFGVNQTQFGANPPPRGTCPQYQFDENTPRRVPQQVTSVPKTYQCIQICPPSSNPSSLLCAPAPPVNRMESKSKIQSTASEMDSSILLAIAKAAINLSLEKQQQECEEEEEEFDEDCDSGYPDILDSIFKE